MSMHLVDRRRFLVGTCSAALLIGSGQMAYSALPRPLRLIGKTVGQVLKAVGKVVRIAISMALVVGTFVWNGSVGVFEAVIGETKTFVVNVAGMTVRLVMKATIQFVEIAGKVSGAFGTLSDKIVVNL